MAKDRLYKDYDNVENLSDLIEAREERDSASADDVDAMEDIDATGLPVDAVDELTWPHPHGRSEEEGRLGTNVNLMDTPDEKEIEFDWQDSVEEMLPTDPAPSEGMGADEIIETLAHVEAAELAGPVPSTEISSEMSTAATEAEKEKYGIDCEEIRHTLPAPVEMDSAMDTDSDEEEFTLEDKFQGEVDRETALLEFEEMQRITRRKRRRVRRHESTG